MPPCSAACEPACPPQFLLGQTSDYPTAPPVRLPAGLLCQSLKSYLRCDTSQEQPNIGKAGL
eukprot:14876955-Alexandrium_andersonii.AAC.1